MSLALLAARAAKNHRSGAFSPLSLYAGGVDGAWFDPSDFSTMFQDTAGTVPVTAAGQSVARINDKSGNGHNATQATTANQPTIALGSGGFWFLSFNGSNWLDCGTGFNATTFGLCIAFNAAAANERLLDARGTGAVGTVKGWALKAWDPTGDDGFVVDSGSAYISSNHTVTAITKHVGYFDHATSSAINWEFEGGTGLTNKTGAALGSTTSTTTSRIGAASNSGTTQALTGGVFQIIVVKKAPSSTEIANMRAWCAAKSGVTL